MHDIVLKNVMIADGTGTTAVPGHVAVTGQRISAVIRDAEDVPSGHDVIDGDGLTVCPGFIDMHAHSDMAVVQDGPHEAKIAQGCTLEVAGQDGLGMAPIRRDEPDSIPELVGMLYGDLDAARGTWETVGEYLDLVDQGSPTNTAYVVPLGTIRGLVMGHDPSIPTPEQMAAMCEEVRRGMAQGGVGISSGLSYAPGSFAMRDELVQLCKVAAEYGGFHDTHHRSYGRRAYEAYQEVIEISEASGCALQLAHAEIDFPENYGRDRDLIRLIDEATRRGVDVAFDILPYDQAMTYLPAMLPSWAHAEGTAGTLQLLQDPESREKIRHAMEVVGSDGAFGVPMGWELFEIAARGSGKTAWVGMNISDAARAEDKAPSEFFFDLLVEESLNVATLIHMGHDDHVRRMMQHHAFMACTDGVLGGEKPHPRGWGTYPRYLGQLCREEGRLRVEECIAHMTSVPASRLRLRDRGLVAEGYFADLVAFDADEVRDTATFDNPRSLPVGIPHVLVNGSFAKRDDVVHEVRSGRAIRRARDTYHASMSS